MKRSITIVLILVLLGVGILVLLNALYKKAPEPVAPDTADIKHEIIGKSVEGRDIEAYIYLPRPVSTGAEADGKAGGDGNTRLMFVGGIHGGYEWNSVLLSYQFMDYLEENPTVIPQNLTIAIIPSANPDGLYKVIGKEGRFTISDVPTKEQALGTGRFNARGVDLNRNFDCKWKPESTWQNKVVSAGSGAFSEPEAAAIRDFVSKYNPAAAVFWHSKANAVYASECTKGIIPKTLDIMNAYAEASGYKAVKSFDEYEISGDAEGWLASINIPAITVELKTHETVEWEQNLAGIKALFNYYTQ